MGKKKVLVRRPPKRYYNSGGNFVEHNLTHELHETSFITSRELKERDGHTGGGDHCDTLPENFEPAGTDCTDLNVYNRSENKHDIVRPANAVVRSIDIEKAKSGTKKEKIGLVPSQSLSESESENDSISNFSCCDAFIYVFCIVTYLADVGSDLFLAVVYFNDRKWVFFALTVTFIIVPSVVNSCFSLVWYMQDSKFYKKNGEKTSVLRWVVRFIFLVLQIGPILRYLEVVIYGCKSRKKSDKKQYYEELMLNEDSDAALLRLLEGFIESAPQLTLQLYIICKFGTEDNVLLKLVQIVSCFTSLASLAWALTSYHRSLRFSLKHKANLGYIGMILQFVWRFFTVGCRVIALALFASVYGYWVFVFIGCHWFAMFIWILLLRTHFCNSRCHEIFFNFVIAIVYVFCFLNVLEGHTRLRYFLYYSLVYFENAALIFGWYIFAHTESIWYLEPALATVLGGFFLGVFFQVIYYLFFHPNNSPPVNPKKRIQMWVPLRVLCTLRSKDESVDENVEAEKETPTTGQKRMLELSKHHTHHEHSNMI